MRNENNKQTHPKGGTGAKTKKQQKTTIGSEELVFFGQNERKPEREREERLPLLWSAYPSIHPMMFLTIARFFIIVFFRNQQRYMHTVQIQHETHLQGTGLLLVLQYSSLMALKKNVGSTKN
jgi:hypothetical protein